MAPTTKTRSNSAGPGAQETPGPTPGQLAARYRVGRLGDEEARRRLGELARLPGLWAAEADELEALGERLGIAVEFRNLDFATGEWTPGRHRP